MRTFFAILSGAGLWYILCAGEVCVIGTADIHGDLARFSRLAPVIRRYPDAVKVDAGDLIQGGFAAAMLRGQPMIAALNSLHYAGWVPGNHEFEFTPEDFAAWRRQFTGRILGAQWRFGEFRPDRFMVVERSGYRIGVIGLGESGMAGREKFVPGLRWEKETAAVRSALTALLPHRCDAVILVCHLPIQGNFGPLYRVLRDNPEIDAVIAAHSHREHVGELVAGRMAVQPGPRGASAALLTLRFDAERKLESVSGQLLRPETEPDRELERIRHRAERRAGWERRGWEFPDLAAFGAFAARAMREECGADAAVFRIRGEAFPSVMDFRSLFRLLPYGNRLGVVEMEERELAELVREQETPPYRVFVDVAPGKRGRLRVAVTDYLLSRSPRLRQLPVRMLAVFERETIAGRLEKSASGTIL
ncbi:MAG: bifunctional metallophosphatase/5'-nucleotidase [Lentisphaeria bacterium]|nr:bifunctional metallophosphatase/5'-nucleotidase [Lentisphaeria bacterium]